MANDAIFELSACLASIPASLLGMLGEHAADWITAFSTFALVIIAAIQFRAIARTSNADFIHRLNSDFYTEGSRNLRKALDEDGLVFRSEGKSGAFDLNSTECFRDEDLDDLVLGPLEAVGIFYHKRAIDLSTTYEMFGTYVIRVWESKAVQDYITWTRKQDNGEDVYDQLQKLYQECKEYQKVKMRR
jgi:hypothetical protein